MSAAAKPGLRTLLSGRLSSGSHHMQRRHALKCARGVSNVRSMCKKPASELFDWWATVGSKRRGAGAAADGQMALATGEKCIKELC